MRLDDPIRHLETACARAGLESSGREQILDGTATELFGL